MSIHAQPPPPPPVSTREGRAIPDTTSDDRQYIITNQHGSTNKNISTKSGAVKTRTPVSSEQDTQQLELVVQVTAADTMYSKQTSTTNTAETKQQQQNPKHRQQKRHRNTKQRNVQKKANKRKMESPAKNASNGRNVRPSIEKGRACSGQSSAPEECGGKSTMEMSLYWERCEREVCWGEARGGSWAPSRSQETTWISSKRLRHLLIPFCKTGSSLPVWWLPPLNYALVLVVLVLGAELN